MSDIKDTINEDYIKKGAGGVKDEDFETVNQKAEEIKKKFNKDGPLGRFIGDIKILLSLVKDYWTKKYRVIPYWAISAVVFALLYVLNPMDLIPDVIPGIGMIDDVLVIGLCLKLVEEELEKYKKWKIDHPE